MSTTWFLKRAGLYFRVVFQRHCIVFLLVLVSYWLDMLDILFRFLNNTSHRSSVAGIQLTSSMPSLWEFCFYGHFLRILRTDHFSLAFNLADSSLCSFFSLFELQVLFSFFNKELFSFFPSKFYYIHLFYHFQTWSHRAKLWKVELLPGLENFKHLMVLLTSGETPWQIGAGRHSTYLS